MASARNSSRGPSDNGRTGGHGFSRATKAGSKKGLEPLRDCQFNVTPQGLKPLFELHSYGTTDVVPSRRKWPSSRSGGALRSPPAKFPSPRWGLVSAEINWEGKTLPAWQEYLRF